MPVRCLQQTHRPSGLRTPGRRLGRIAPHAHLPVSTLSRTERLASIFDPCGLRRGNALGVPNITLVLTQDLGAACDKHVISALAANAARWLQNPAQAWLR